MGWGLNIAITDQFASSGSARVTEFATSATAQTFNYVVSTLYSVSLNIACSKFVKPGDIGFVPAGYGALPTSYQILHAHGYFARALRREYWQ